MARRARLIGFEVVLPAFGLLLTLPQLLLMLRLGFSPLWALTVLGYILPIIWGLRRLVLISADANAMWIGNRLLASDDVSGLIFEHRRIVITTRQENIAVGTGWTTAHLIQRWRERVEEMGYPTLDADAAAPS